MRRTIFAIGFAAALVALLVGSANSPARAASSDRVLILAGTVTGGTSSIEATEAAADGLAVDIVDASTWSSMTAAQFASYRAIILGDPTCQGAPPTPDANAAAANAKVWGPVVNGNIVILGTDPVYHASQGGSTVTQRGVDFAVNQAGKTGAYITLSCYYHETAPNTPVPLLDGIGAGGFTVTGVGCYNNAHIVAESPALASLTDADLSNWACSVHEAFQTWSSGLIPLAIAKDFDSSFTASDGTQGPPYILAGGDIKSFPLSLSPLSDSAPAGGTHTVTAQLLDGSTRNPVSGAKVGFKVTAGTNTAVTGTCNPSSCLTDTSGQVSWTYRSNGSTGSDTIAAFYDQNGNGSADVGEPQTTAGMDWQSVPLQRYVAFGDSVPYGQGLADPSMNNPPSTQAYPGLLDTQIPGLRPLKYRATGCDLTGDQLAISGAPSIDNAWTGQDKSCNLPVQRAVFLDETNAANLVADPPALVTIQAGADDINFSGCLIAVLGLPRVPRLFKPHACVRGPDNRLSLTSEATSELASLQSGLTAIINTVHRKAPGAQIVLVNYYQILPSPSEAVLGSSDACRWLRFRSNTGIGWRQSIYAQGMFVQQKLNQAIASVAGQFGDVQFVDISRLFDGHELCTGNTWLFDAHDVAHPTTPGQAAIAQSIETVCAIKPKDCVGH